jgi:hypothetical protein
MTEKTVPGIRSRGVRYWAERRGFRVVPPSTDVQDRLAGELPIDKPAGDRADLAPWGLDRNLRSQLFCGDQIGEQREADAGTLDAHQFVEQGKPVDRTPPVAKKSRLSKVA